jgi:hypothetical protein
MVNEGLTRFKNRKGGGEVHGIGIAGEIGDREWSLVSAWLGMGGKWFGGGDVDGKCWF